jgi:phage-related protein
LNGCSTTIITPRQRQLNFPRAAKEPVREWLKELSKEDRLRIGTDIKTVKYGWPTGMPTCRPMSNGVFEVRTNLDSRIARVPFCISGGQIVLLNGFVKKTNKTQQRDLELAISRKRKAHLGSSLDSLLEEDFKH